MERITRDVTKSPIRVDEIRVGQFQKKGTQTAMLRQDVTTVTHYPSATHSSNMQQNPFGSADFTEDTTQDYESVEHRVAFIDVPEGMTIEQVQAKLPKTACLYKVLSNAPILTDNDHNAIQRGLITKDQSAQKQVTVYPTGHPKEGEIILDPQGRMQYRRVFYWGSPKADQDIRGDEKYPEYIPESLKEAKARILETEAPAEAPVEEFTPANQEIDA